jgi:hypothetical protein
MWILHLTSGDVCHDTSCGSFLALYQDHNVKCVCTEVVVNVVNE